MKKTFALAVLGAMLLLTLAAQAQIYNLEVTTSYSFTNPAGNQSGYVPSPDTSFVTITNNGLTTFTGTISDSAVSQFAGDFSQTFAGVTLAPGQSFVFTTSPESSNVGGFNGPFGSPQPGIGISLVGLIAGTESVNLSVNDSAIHSGVFQTNPFGISLDNYVLQGGDPLGRDPGDGFEIAQASGHYTFTNSTAVPEPTSLALLGSGLIGLAGTLRKRLL